ncbi:uncharacterized protein EI90DRAFT_3043966 [Cantharellus anzutake]|uniref:uncharacterized protein n=1 Tax=Cantharellus anzutake TaxID=1750568 RepID=UPI0019087AFF|nr:uncharacterized protein EI90DRAFT_3043966 [Cantharellus anzutake]KAF8336881.1 hypothetical protein EI90DRAFT_3043966 [Cantharellus anzutake]
MKGTARSTSNSHGRVCRALGTHGLKTVPTTRGRSRAQPSQPRRNARETRSTREHRTTVKVQKDRNGAKGESSVSDVTLVEVSQVRSKAVKSSSSGHGKMRSSSTVAGIPNSNGHRRTEDRRLRCEVGKMNARGIPYAKFLDATFPTWKDLPANLVNKLRNELLELRDKYLEVAKNPGSKEEDLYTPFANLMHGFLRDNAGLSEYEYVPSHRKRKIGGAVGGQREGIPDGVVIRKPSEKSDPTNADDLNWRNLHLVIDLKTTKNFGASLNPPKSNSGMTEDQIKNELKKDGGVRLDGRQQLASYGLEQLSSNPLKQFCYGMVVIGHFVEMWYYDRSGPIGTEVIDLRKEDHFEQFYQHMVAISGANPSGLGFNPHFNTIKWPIPVDSQKITIGGRLISFDASKPIHISRGLTGRCTTVFPAWEKTFGTESEPPYVLKLSYQPCDRKPSEADHYALLLAKGVEGIPEILCSEKFPSLAEEGPRGALMKHLPGHEFGPMRYLEAIVMADKLKPITSIDINKDTKVFFQVFLSTIEIHRQAFAKANILHRDIHVDNLMCMDVDGGPTGFLIDWDFASGPDSHPPENLEQTAFTLNGKFLAIDLLRTESQARFYRHDLESFFWLLWSIVLTQASIVEWGEIVSKWEQDTVDERRARKTYFLDRTVQEVIARLMECEESGLSHSGVIECLVQLSFLISDGQDALLYRTEVTNVETADDHITYAKFVAALELAIQ